MSEGLAKDSRKQSLGREAEELIKEVRRELARMLDETIGVQESIFSTDLFSDFQESLKFWAETLEIFQERMEFIANDAKNLELREAEKALPR